MNTLRLGSTGENVIQLQIILKYLGYYNGIIDGIFGNSTEQAVINFQQDKNLTPDGIIGPITWTLLTPYIDLFNIYTIKTGDTFNNIAKNNNIRLEDLIQANPNVNPNNLQVNQQILIPTNSQNDEYIYYIINPGDTLYDLAIRFGTNINAILTANPTTSPNNLQVGNRILIPSPTDIVKTNINYTYNILRNNLQSLQVRYPFLQVGSIGQSVLGKELFYIKLGNGNSEVFYNGSHHANEWITSVLLMKYIENFSKAYSSGSNIGGYNTREIWQNKTIYIVPMVNPDGVDLVTGAIPINSPTYNNALALNTPNTPFPTGWKANIRGVDLNLNYPADWERAKEIKASQGVTNPGPKWYVGPFPLSEPETQAVAAFTRLHNFRLVLAYHTQGKVIYWKYLEFNPPNALEIANQFAEVSGYVVTNTPYESAFAGYKDWFIQEYNRPGYTIEAGIGINPLPISQFNNIYNDNVGILTLGAIL